MKRPQTPPKKKRKTKTKPQRCALDIGKWIALEMLAEKYGFELKEPTKQ